jgi:hypothetical protein
VSRGAVERRSWALLSLLAFAVCLAGCAAPRREDSYVLDVEADSVRIDGPAANATTAPDGRRYQFRAVCTESVRHAGAGQVLSKWVDDIAVARELGQYHGNFKAKGHRWHIERRIQHQAHP